MSDRPPVRGILPRPSAAPRSAPAPARQRMRRPRIRFSIVLIGVVLGVIARFVFPGFELNSYDLPEIHTERPAEPDYAEVLEP